MGEKQTENDLKKQSASYFFRLNAQAAEEIKMKMPLSSAEDSTKVRRGGKSGKNGQIKHNLINPK
ncbi:MAG: hypothetical protein IKR90_01315 [Clostridia bacterium]|nr:hypothetical protein [Clostridia bacterium]